MPIYNEEKFYRLRLIDPFQSFVTWVLAIITLFPVFLLLAYFLEAEVTVIAVTYLAITVVVSALVAYYLYGPTISYDSFLEKYHNIVPRDKTFKEWFSERSKELGEFEDLHEEFQLYFFDIAKSIKHMDGDEIDSMFERLIAYDNIVTNTRAPEQLRLLCNLLEPFSSVNFRSVPLEDIKDLSRDFYKTKSQFHREMEAVNSILVDARDNLPLQLEN